jgi:hypothetical protein
MILPTKHIPEHRCLLGLGGELLRLLEREHTVSSLWETVRAGRNGDAETPEVPFDWFILTLDFLFLIGAVKSTKGLLVRSSL